MSRISLFVLDAICGPAIWQAGKAEDGAEASDECCIPTVEASSGEKVAGIDVVAL